MARWFQSHATRWGEAHRGLSCSLCSIAMDINRIRIDVDCTPFVPTIVTTRSSWSAGTFDNHRQHDVTEAMALLLDTLNSIDEKAVLPQTGTFDTPMWQSLQIQRISQLRCHRCQCTSDKLERLTPFPLEVPTPTQQLSLIHI